MMKAAAFMNPFFAIPGYFCDLIYVSRSKNNFFFPSKTAVARCARLLSFQKASLKLKKFCKFQILSV
jgi:1-acyl-sn-glycerol-3-phosphate acyltransferase